MTSDPDDTKEASECLRVAFRYVHVPKQSMFGMIRTLLFICSLFLVIAHSSGKVEALKDDDDVEEVTLWEPADAIRVLGPTNFPKPSSKAGKNAKVVLQPFFGTHRSDADVVMAYAEGYTLAYYLSFVSSLQDTGFDGDIVLCVAPLSYLAPGVEEYLRSQPNMVVYLADMICYEEDRVTKGQRTVKNGSPDAFQMCAFDHVYAIPQEDGSLQTVEDPREGRVVASLRYELYWMWCLHYNPNQWIMLLDARDSYFQLDPFANLPRRSNSTSGLLHFFGENAEATRLGLSTKNMKWLLKGYGPYVLDALKDKPTICSGATMGEQIAIETYLRAMVNEKDESPIRMTGADQGFHNYLYWSNKLANADRIESITVFDHGKGVVNNLGALREKPLDKQGVYNPKSNEVYNWDHTLSPVVHQWDRDKKLHNWRFRIKFSELESEYKKKLHQPK